MPEAALILDLIEAFRRSKTMFTAVQLGIFDQLQEEPQTAAQVARSLQLDASSTARLLDGCVALGLLNKADRRYSNSNAATTYLTSSSPDTLAGYIRYSDESLYPLWGRLADAVREGSNRWQQVFGSRSALFDHYFRDPAATKAFLDGMHGFGQLASKKIVSAFDLAHYRSLADLGGATGHLAVAACRRYPHLQAIVVDLPAVTPYARAAVAAAGLANRISVIDTDFFHDPLPAADLYYLGRILHDWDDAKIRYLLSQIKGDLLIGETLLNEDHTAPVHSVMQDLNMLICTDGRERTPMEYRALLLSAGFTQVQFGRTGSLIDAILATRTGSASST